MKFFYQIIDSCKKYSLSEVQETRNSKKNRPSWLYQAKNRSNIAIGLKWQKSFKIQIFLLIRLVKPKRLCSLLSKKLMELCYAEEQPAKALGGL